jgi:tetratricopeptide (TPR) repeat protein
MKPRRVHVEVVPADSRGAAQGPRRPRWFVPVVLTFLAIATIAAWFTLESRPRLPAVDLSNASLAVRETIERHLNEVQRHPRSATAWGQLGSVLYAYRLLPPARTALERAEELDPQNPRWPYLHGLTHLAGDRNLVVTHLRRAVTLCGSQPAAPQLRLARILAEQGRWQEAEHHLNALLAVDSAPPHAFLLAANLARHKGDFPAAIDWSRRASTNPAVARPALSMLSALLARHGHAAEAMDAAARAANAPGGDLIHDPFDAEAQALRADALSFSERVHPLLARGHLEAASTLVSQMIATYPEYPDTWLAAGRLQFLLKNPATAEQHLRRHVQLDPNSVQGWFQLGMALLSQGRSPEAADAFGKAVELKPDLAPAWHNRGLALGRVGKRAEAMEAFRQVLRHSPEHMDAYLLMADLQFSLGDEDAAMASLERAALLKPDDQRVSALRRKIRRD